MPLYPRVAFVALIFPEVAVLSLCWEGRLFSGSPGSTAYSSLMVA